MSKFSLILAIVVMLIVIGCQWDPPHDNPLDPKVPPAPLSQITIQVLDLSHVPIENAKVILREIDKDIIASTDSGGWAHFDELPVGETWWAVADKNNGDTLKYAVDSIRISSSLGETNTAIISLDAMPYFTKVSVISINNQLSDITNEFIIRLKAEVNDPDGIPDITSITWEFNDTLSGNLSYNPHLDSSFYETEITEDIFKGIGQALTQPFIFKVTDNASNFATVQVSLVRIINGYPSIHFSITWTEPILFRWNFNIDRDFPGGDIFYYLLQVEKQNIDQTTDAIYTEVINEMSGAIVHRVSGIPNGNYDYFVYVIDEFGNRSRSMRLQVIKSTDS